MAAGADDAPPLLPAPPFPLQPLPPPAAPAAGPSRSEQLAEVLTPHLSLYEGRLGLVIKDLEGGARFEYDAQRPFVSASVYKLAVAYEVLRQVDLGNLSLDDLLTIEDGDTWEEEPGGGLGPGDDVTVGMALESMMGLSSNSGAYALMRLVGRPQLNASLAALGLQQTSVPLLAGEAALPGSAPYDPEFAVTTPADMAHLLWLLETDRLLTPGSRQELERLLALEEPVDPLRQGLPPEVEVLAKSGSLEGANNTAGVIRTARGSVVVAAFTEAIDPGEAREMIASLGRLAYQLFSP